VYGADNGMLYSIDLDTKLNKSAAQITMAPTVLAYKYGVKGKKTFGILSSVAMYDHYVYMADVNGILQCVDLETMTCVWSTNVRDVTHAAIALEEMPNGEVALYTGTIVDYRDRAYLRRYNALTGEMVWEYQVRVNKSGRDAHNGVAASPIVGTGDISDLVIFTVNRTSSGGSVIALDKETGVVPSIEDPDKLGPVWEELLDASTWSSPLAVYTPEGISYIIQGDSTGKLRIMDGVNGNTLDSVQLENAILGSPAAYNDMIIIGVDGPRFYGIRIR
jgi:outer membrane protein assembly factor BamB